MNQNRNDLSGWLKHLEQLHPTEIELGLDRVKQVAINAGLDRNHCPLISVAGTNGKGSVVAFLTAIYKQAGYSVGTYTSPHIRHYNERICIDGMPVPDADIVDAFERIDAVRQSVSLTYFEYSTLAALSVFKRRETDIVILEVGLGGKLDAVNLRDADVSVITTIAVDHESWLGNSREVIAIEKAGIARKDKPIVIGDRNPPESLLLESDRIGSRMHCIQKDFDYSLHEGEWDFSAKNARFKGLPVPRLRGAWQFDNASVAINAALQLLDRLPINQQHFSDALTSVSLAGRYQHGTYKQHPVILDVGHNPAAVSALFNQLACDYSAGVTAVFAVMKDKDVAGIVKLASAVVNHWFLPELDMGRAMCPEEVKMIIHEADATTPSTSASSVFDALEQAILSANTDEPVVVFGSFFTLAEIAEFVD